MSNRKNKTNEAAIFDLWLNWVIAGGAINMPILLSVYIKPLFIPIIAMVFAFGLMVYDRTSMRSHSGMCSLIITIAMRSLFYSALIMVFISLIYTKGYISYFYDYSTLNTAIPFVTLLIIAPMVVLTILWSLLRGNKYSVCARCHMLYGPKTERGFIGKIYSQESNYQRNFLLGISSVLTLLAWGYYTYFYINVNINIPDRVFFGWVPLILYALSIFYLGARCFSLWAYYCQDEYTGDGILGSSTSIRVLIISGDRFYLSREDEYNEIPDGFLFDTPAKVTINHYDNLTTERATTSFCDISRLSAKDFSLRFMYVSREVSGNRNTYHYICCPKSDKLIDKSLLKGRWYNLSQVQRLLHNRELTPSLAAEIHRLYTITMAWKTYDADGYRLYKVKNYHPLFRLDGICEWDVDFNSPTWLDVANLNEDKPFFRLRKLWRNLYAIK